MATTHRSPAARASSTTRFGAVLLSVALATAACGGGGEDEGADEDGSGASGEPLTVGVVEALTGATALGGIANMCGTKVAVADINARGGVLGGRPLQLEVRDTQSTPAIASQVASELTDEGIQFFVSASSSAQLLAMLPILNDAGAMHTGGVSKAPEVIEAGDLVVRINSNGTQDAAPAAAYLKASAQTVAFVGSQGAYGEPAVAAIAEGMGSGVEEVGRFIVPPETTDFTSVMTQIAGLAPDAVVFAIAGNEQTVGLFRDFDAAGVESQLVAPPGLLTPLVVEAAGDSADGAVGSGLYAPTLDTPGNELLTAAWDTYAGDIEECADAPLDDYVALSYGQVLLLALAMDEADSDDPETVRATILEGSFELPQGTVTFDEDGQIADPTFYGLRAENGTVVLAEDIPVQ